MALKSFNPYTASRRFVTMLDKSEITKQTPEKSLVEPKKRTRYSPETMKALTISAR